MNKQLRNGRTIDFVKSVQGETRLFYPDLGGKPAQRRIGSITVVSAKGPPGRDGDTQSNPFQPTVPTFFHEHSGNRPAIVGTLRTAIEVYASTVEPPFSDPAEIDRLIAEADALDGDADLETIDEREIDHDFEEAWR
ncbi:MAG: hypothetical protein AAFR11_14325 [Pseudomonadota bacterium]